MSHKLGICIPYRNRKEHLEKLIPRLSALLDSKGIEYRFYVGHQLDDKLFNRGAMKNVAAMYAFEDGCDYVAWHDVDMLPDDECDYSYPEDNPIHIATKLSKYNYGMGYEQYFGGVVLFTKEQVENTNGYSNEYWDWGQEDDDLFWRSYFEGYTCNDVYRKYPNKKVGVFDGKTSHVTVPCNREVSDCLNNDYTITMLFSAEQQPEKTPIWLVGDDGKRFMEYPILRKDGAWTWGMSFNNSRALSFVTFDRNNMHNYVWAKRFELMWTWFTVSYDSNEKLMYVYVNGELVRNIDGNRESLPYEMKEMMRRHDSTGPFLLGFCNHTGNRLKGKIADLRILNRVFLPNEIESVYDNEADTVLRYDFSDEAGMNSVCLIEEDVEVIKEILPFRREGSFLCLPHEDEGFVNGRWAKGDTTARNEKRFVTEMQQRKINYKNEGINKIKELIDVMHVDHTSYPKTTIINVRMI